MTDCSACQDGWLSSQSSCYAINNPHDSDQKTWEEAQADCRRKNSDLVVVADETEKVIIVFAEFHVNLNLSELSEFH